MHFLASPSRYTGMKLVTQETGLKINCKQGAQQNCNTVATLWGVHGCFVFDVACVDFLAMFAVFRSFCSCFVAAVLVMLSVLSHSCVHGKIVFFFFVFSKLIWAYLYELRSKKKEERRKKNEERRRQEDK